MLLECFILVSVLLLAPKQLGDTLKLKVKPGLKELFLTVTLKRLLETRGSGPIFPDIVIVGISSDTELFG